MKAPHLLLSSAFAWGLLTTPFAVFAVDWKWDNASIPDLGFDLDQAEVIRVTSLDTKGPGSLREALDRQGPRIVVFEVGGVIDLELRGLKINHDQVIVAGQTAPAPGITLIRGGISVDASQVLIQHLAVRPGDAGKKVEDDWTPDGLSTVGANHDIWIDNCSFTWAVDENLSASSYKAPEGAFAHRIHMRDCLIAEGLSESSHPDGEHSKGTLIMDGTQEVAIVRCLYAANVERNPVFKSNTSAVVVNCLMAGCGQRAIHGRRSESAASQVAVVGTVVKLAEHSKKTSAILEGDGDWYAKDNLGFAADGGTLELIRKGEVNLSEAPVWPEGLEAIPASEVEAVIRSHVGARPGMRDAIDARIVEQAFALTNRIIDSQEEVGGYPSYPSTRRELEVPASNRREWLTKLDAEVSGTN